MTGRVEIIEEVLIYHHKRKTADGLECLCGYQFTLGGSIYRHTAEVIESALTYAEEVS